MNADSGFDSLSDAERIYVEARRAAGDSSLVDVDRLCSAHPELSAELRRIHQEQMLLSDALGFPRGAVGSHSSPGGVLARTGSDPADPDPRSPLLDRLRLEVSSRQASPLRYRFRRLLGRGGMGVVLEHWDEHLRRPVAMKLVRGTEARPTDPASASGIDRLLAEARITGQLEHPGIVPLHDLGVDAEGRVYFTMRVVEGRNLHEVIRTSRRGEEGWSIPRALGVIHRACEAVAFAHSRGVIHRDLKPGNVMIGRFGETYVMDWGLARVLDSEEQPGDPATPWIDGDEDSSSSIPAAGDGRVDGRTRHGQRLGSPCYMSPEQARGDWRAVDRRSDVYSLGAILYELLAGIPPYGEGEHAARFFDRIQVEPPRALAELAPDAPQELVSICERAMARAPADRYRGVEELADDLRAYLEVRVVKAHRTGPWAELRKWIARNRVTAGAIAATALSVTIGLLVYLREVQRTSNVQRQLATQQEESLSRSELAQAAEAMRRGAWNVVLQKVDGVGARGYPDALELDLIRAEALLAKDDLDACDEVLRRIELAKPSGTRRGRQLLIAADRLQLDMGTRGQALATVEEALAAGLEPASEQYARALVEPTTNGALAALERCVEMDPFHHRARALRLTLLFYTGRFDQAREEARIMLRIYPDDPRPALTLALVAATLGDRTDLAARMDHLRRILTEEELLAVQAAVDLFGLVPRMDVRMFLTNDDLGQANLVSSIYKVVKRAPSLERFRQFLPPNLRCLEATYGPLLEVMPFPSTGSVQEWITWTATIPLRLDRASLEQALATALSHDPENGWMLYLYAHLRINRPLASGEEQIEKIREAGINFAKAMNSKSFLHGANRAARYWLVHCEFQIAREQGDAAMRERCLANIRTLLDVEDPTSDETKAFYDRARDLGDLDLALRIAEHRARLYPKDQAAVARRIEAQLAVGMYESALESARSQRKTFPKNKDFPTLEVAARNRLIAAAQAAGAEEPAK